MSTYAAIQQKKERQELNKILGKDFTSVVAKTNSETIMQQPIPDDAYIFENDDDNDDNSF